MTERKKKYARHGGVHRKNNKWYYEFQRDGVRVIRVPPQGRRRGAIRHNMRQGGHP